jgi:hypothetical protein
MRKLLIGSVVLLMSAAGFAHTGNFTNSGSGPQPDHWASMPVVWNLNPSRGSNMAGGRSVADVMSAAFGTWASAPDMAVSPVRGADSSKTSAGFDNENTICFSCSGDFSKDATTLAVTMTTTATDVGSDDGRGGTTKFVGQILDADMLFNPNTQYSTDGPSSGVNDLQTVATHEAGHFFGLNHSAIVKAVMFPYSPDQERVLSFDDVAAMAELYPKANPEVPLGSISGTVRLNGNGVFGAHVYAESQTGANPFNGFNVRKSPVSALSLPDGTYKITGVPADVYVITAEPLDLPVVNNDISDFPKGFGQGAVQTNFTTRWH